MILEDESSSGSIASLLDNLRTGFYPISLNGWQATSADWWMPIIEAGRGEPVLLSPREPVLDDVDLVVVRTHVPKEVQAMCDKAMIPVVIEDWLLENIIRGKK
ncbi:hypothetical protein RvY_00295-2 [Ramazzottius varieornatus]|uniref:BRCT domain-containing protein n=1 Tax=Ramazzottius varieornatus TaxID=947166 RepID=A0A1D1UCA9_RAMVA|nr:hypothetical protein RvY_00295-2 [Ramazzottius varieornatus]